MKILDNIITKITSWILVTAFLTVFVLNIWRLTRVCSREGCWPIGALGVLLVSGRLILLVMATRPMSGLISIRARSVRFMKELRWLRRTG